MKAGTGCHRREKTQVVRMVLMLESAGRRQWGGGRGARRMLRLTPHSSPCLALSGPVSDLLQNQDQAEVSPPPESPP